MTREGKFLQAKNRYNIRMLFIYGDATFPPGGGVRLV